MKERLKVLCFLLMGLGVWVDWAGAETPPVWPLATDLMCKEWSVADSQAWVDVGDVKILNTRDDLKIEVRTKEGFKLKEVQIHVTLNDTADFVPILNRKGKPIPGKFTYKKEYPELADEHTLALGLHDVLDVCWGVPEKCPLTRYIVIHAELARFNESTGSYDGIAEGAYAFGSGVFLREITGYSDEIAPEWGWYIPYPIAKVETGHFVDAKVNGLAYETPTQSGITGDSGGFDYIPGERADFRVGSLSLGSALGDHNVTPVDLFEGADLDDDRVLNVARLLQSLDSDGDAAFGPILITDPVIACLESAMTTLNLSSVDFAYDSQVKALIDGTVSACEGSVPLVAVTKEDARENLDYGQQAANILKTNVSKNPGLKTDKAKLEIMPVYVPSQTADGTPKNVVYYDEAGNIIETRDKAKPIVVAYLEEVEGTGASDVFVAVSRDDGSTWKRRNISRTADKLFAPSGGGTPYPGNSEKPVINVKGNKIFLAWTDKHCRGGRPRYAITVCPDADGDGAPDASCEVCRDTHEDLVCTTHYDYDDPYYQEDLYGAGGPQRSVVYEDYPEMGEVPFSCVWTARGVIDPLTGDIQWFKPERLTSGRRDAYQVASNAQEDVGFALVWQEDPKGLMPGEGDGPGDGWSGANTHNKADIWYSFIKWEDFDLVTKDYTALDNGENLVDKDPDVVGRLNALVPMSIPVKVSDNDVCSLENILAEGGGEDIHTPDELRQGTHRYCGEVDGIGTAENPGTNPLCAYTVEKINPNGEIRNVCVTQDGRLLDGNTGASRPNLFLMPYSKTLTDGTTVKSAYAIIGYEESKGVGSPPEETHEEEDVHAVSVVGSVVEDDTRYKPDMGKNVIYHSFDFASPGRVEGGGIVNLPETDAAGNPVYLKDEFGNLLLDWKGAPQLAYENARRVRFLAQPKSKAGPSKTVMVVLYRQGEEGSGKPADIFMRRVVAPSTGNPYAFANFVLGAQNLTSVEPTEMFQDPFDPGAPVKMLRWGWSPDNLQDSSSKNPYTDARAHRGAIDGDRIIIGYTWTPNWGRNANDKYDLYIRRSFNGGQSWTTDAADPAPIEHNVVFKVPVTDDLNQVLTWDEEVVTTTYQPGESEPPRNVSNLRNNRMSVLEPRIVKTPGSISSPDGTAYPEDTRDEAVYQVAYGLEFNQNQAPNDVIYPKMPLDIYYSRTKDKGQRFETVIVTPQDGSGKPQEGWNPMAKDKPQQGAVQLRQTPDGSRMYAVWQEDSESGSDIMFRRVDYRPAPQQ